jgi:MFS family permease
MRGQAQALYQLLVGSVAGIIGSFFCETVYQRQVTDELSSWSGFWWVLAAFALIPLAYFFIGVIGKPSEQEQ